MAQNERNRDIEQLRLPAVADMHVHLRQDAMCELVTPMLAPAGVGCALVMPNTVPPITTTAQALEYKARLEKLAPGVKFLMTLYLTTSLTPEEIQRARESGVVAGIKYYPHGVTTNSTQGGCTDERALTETLRPQLLAIQENNLVLNIHGECVHSDPSNVTMMTAESKFMETVLPELRRLYPRIRLVVEHATTAAAVNFVLRQPEKHLTACTVTPHHLHLVVDDWAGGTPHYYCKPVAKTYADRAALRDAVVHSDQVFLGSDSAPHAKSQKELILKPSQHAPAGIYHGPAMLPILASLFDQIGALHKLPDFIHTRASKFYNLGDPRFHIVLHKLPTSVPASYTGEDAEIEVVPFFAEQRLEWSIMQKIGGDL